MFLKSEKCIYKNILYEKTGNLHSVHYYTISNARIIRIRIGISYELQTIIGQWRQIWFIFISISLLNFCTKIYPSLVCFSVLKFMVKFLRYSYIGNNFLILIFTNKYLFFVSLNLISRPIRKNALFLTWSLKHRILN